MTTAGHVAELSLGRELAYPTNVLHLATECANRKHSAAFPVALPDWFIRLFTQAGDVVLDPFIGSGTTAIAAARLGRSFIGVEIKAEHAELAKSRVSEAIDLVTPIVVRSESEVLQSCKPVKSISFTRRPAYGERVNRTVYAKQTKTRP